MKISLRYLRVATLASFALVMGFGISGVEQVGARAADQDTHGRDATPDYARVFNQEQVGRLDVTITASDWQALVDDMTSMAGAQGGQTTGAPGPRRQPEPWARARRRRGSDRHVSAGGDRRVHRTDGRERMQLRHTTSERPLCADRQCRSACLHSTGRRASAERGWRRESGTRRRRAVSANASLHPRGHRIRWRDISPRRLSSEGQLESRHELAERN